MKSFTTEQSLIRRMLLGGPFTFADLGSTPLADRTIQKLRRQGLIEFERKGRACVWRKKANVVIECEEGKRNIEWEKHATGPRGGVIDVDFGVNGGPWLAPKPRPSRAAKPRAPEYFAERAWESLSQAQQAPLPEFKAAFIVHVEDQIAAAVRADRRHRRAS